MENLPQWDLNDLYAGIDDPKLKKDIQQIKSDVLAFESTYREKITDKTSAEDILTAITRYEAIKQAADKVVSFAQLCHMTNTDKPEYGNFWQQQLETNIAISNELLFFDLALSALSEQKTRMLIENPLMSDYAHFLQVIAAWKPHRLSEKEERIINDKMATGQMAFSRLYNQQHARRMFDFSSGGEVQKLTLSQMVAKLQSPDRQERKDGAKCLTQGLKQGAEISSYAYNMVISNRIMDSRYFKFEKPEDSRHLENETSRNAVDVMVSVISQNQTIVKDFYEHKRELLGLEKLYDYDRYAPLEGALSKIPFADGKKVVLESFEKFSPHFCEIAEEFFSKRWIDAPSRPGKIGGAYCHYVTPDLHPYIMLNYQGDVADVSTLAHELGHGVHARLAQKQTFLNFNWPLTLAETASVFGEMLVFDALKERAESGSEKIALYAGAIERIFASVFRQNAMFLFERDVFAATAEDGQLSVKKINALWRKRQEEMFNGSVTLTPDYDIWWSYIPHFVDTPFYVYAYSFGELLSLSLFAKYRKEGAAFTEKYFALLQAGGSKSPQELLAPMGIDLSQKEFWENGVALIRELVDEFKTLS